VYPRNVTLTQPPANDDKTWADANRRVVERAYSVFMETGEWPKLTELRRYFVQQYQPVDVDAVVRSQPHFPGELRPYQPDRLQLSIRHLRYVFQNASQLILICLAITRGAVDAYRSLDDPPRVTSEDPQIAVLAGNDKRMLIRAGQILQAEWPSPLAGGGSGPEHWDYFVNDALIMEFERAFTADDFVARQQAIAERHDKAMAKHYVGYAVPPESLGALELQALNEDPESLGVPNQANLNGEGSPTLSPAIGTKIFVVHGQNSAVKLEVAEFVEKVIGERPVILHEQADEGSRTIIEKFEDHASSSGYAIVILTADDVGGPKGGGTSPRARQNVVFEFGYFVARLSRRRVVALYEEGVELPSDVSGVLYKPLSGNWKLDLGKDLKVAGFDVSFENL